MPILQSFELKEYIESHFNCRVDTKNLSDFFIDFISFESFMDKNCPVFTTNNLIEGELRQYFITTNWFRLL